MDYLSSLYEGNTAYRESVLFIKDRAQKASSKLLHECDEIIKAENISGEFEWQEGKDFTVDGDIIALAQNTTVPCFENDFPKAKTPHPQGDFRHSDSGYFRYFANGKLHEHQMFITYKIKKRNKIYQHKKARI